MAEKENFEENGTRGQLNPDADGQIDAVNHADPDAAGAVPTEPHMRTERGRFTRAGASEAAKQRWKRARANQPTSDTAEDGGNEDIRIVQAPIRISRIIGGLEREAVQGNPHAARELRAWLQDYPPRDDSIKAEDLDRRTRDRLLARLLAEIEEEDDAESSEADKSHGA
jgi:hypothetical protein